MSKEAKRLENIASMSLYNHGANKTSILYAAKIIRRHIRGNTILEMGPAEGEMTGFLADTGLELHIVEGAKAFADDLAARFPAANVTHALFEEYSPKIKFDNIILGHVLEHVEDPVDILARAKRWLAESGRIFAAVPNCRSIHRQAAVIMGLLNHIDQLNETDHHHGHRRVYSPESFRQDFLKAGLSIDVSGGYWLKPVSNGQIERDWTPEMVDAFMALGEWYPDIAGEIYVIASSVS